MKKYPFFTAIFAAAVAFFTIFGCKKSSDGPLPNPAETDTFFVKMNQAVAVPSGGFTIRLDSVLSDSRCPTNVICVWEGRMDARFSIIKNDAVAIDTLAVGAIDAANWPDDKTTQFGFKIQLIEMAPYPENPGTIAQAEYVAKLLVLPE